MIPVCGACGTPEPHSCVWDDSPAATLMRCTPLADLPVRQEFYLEPGGGWPIALATGVEYEVLKTWVTRVDEQRHDQAEHYLFSHLVRERRKGAPGGG